MPEFPFHIHSGLNPSAANSEGAIAEDLTFGFEDLPNSQNALHMKLVLASYLW